MKIEYETKGSQRGIAIAPAYEIDAGGDLELGGEFIYVNKNGIICDVVRYRVDGGPWQEPPKNGLDDIDLPTQQEISDHMVNTIVNEVVYAHNPLSLIYKLGWSEKDALDFIEKVRPFTSSRSADAFVRGVLTGKIDRNSDPAKANG
jgi:hypothetical protein